MNSESPNKNSGLYDDEITVKELLLGLISWFKYLLSKWYIIVGFALLGALIGYYYASTKKITYTATTTFVLEDGNKASPMSNLGGLASIAGIDLGSGGGGIFQGDNIFQLYKSRLMLEKTLFTTVDYQGEPILLINKLIDFNKLRNVWNQDPKLKGLKFEQLSTPEKQNTRVQDSIIGYIVDVIDKKYLDVHKPDKKLSIVQADVTASDEFFAKNFNSALVKNVNDFYIQTRTKKSIENVNILQKKVDSVRAVMNGAIFDAVAANDATPNLNPTRQVMRLAPAQRAQYSAEASKIVLSNLMQNLELSKLNLLKEKPLIEVIDEPKFPLKVEGQGKLKSLILFGFIFGFLAVVYFIVRKVIRDAIS